MNTTTYGLDIAKTVFQLYWVEPSGKCSNRRFSRPKLLEFLSNREPTRAIEAGARSFHLLSLGQK